MADEKETIQQDVPETETPEEEVDTPVEEVDTEEASEETKAAAEESDEAEAAPQEESGDEKYLRLMADFQNYRRRVEKEKADVYSFANEKIMTDILGVLDNFERAIQQESADEAYAAGMQLIFKQLLDVLTKEGLTEIESLGQAFDPELHHAVLTDENPDFESGAVTEVLQKGYKLNDRVIRPTMVKVNN